VRHRDSLALDRVLSHGGGVEEHVDDVIVEQVHLVDVEDVAVRLGEDAGLELLLTALDCGLDVDRADDAILGGVDGQFHDTHLTAAPRQRLPALHPHGALGALQVGIIGWAAVAAVGHDVKPR
jgi:hypothetical protein